MVPGMSVNLSFGCKGTLPGPSYTTFPGTQHLKRKQIHILRSKESLALSNQFSLHRRRRGHTRTLENQVNIFVTPVIAE